MFLLVSFFFETHIRKHIFSRIDYKINTMFKKTIFLIVIIYSSSGHSQAEKVRKHAIGFETYFPIDNGEFSHLYESNSMMFNKKDRTKNVHNSFGISYERHLQGGFFIRPRVGMTVFNLQMMSNEIIANAQMLQINQNNFEHQKQRNLNLFLGFGKKINLTKGLSLDLGADFAFIRYGKREMQFIMDYVVINRDVNVYFESHETQVRNGSISASTASGFGIILKPEYRFDNNITLSFESQLFYLTSNARVLQIFNSNLSLSNFENGFINTASSYNIATTETEFRTAKGSSWSYWTPLLRIGYVF